VNLGRLMVLGLLSAEGPLHGHAIRRRAELVSVDRWGGVSPGALHRELHWLDREGLVRVVRSEQPGRRPARTVYAITEEGERELAVLRDRALRDTMLHPDPIGVALLFGGRVDARELVEALAYRRQTVTAMLERLASERVRLAGRLDPLGLAVFRRGEHLLAAERNWHEEVERALSATLEVTEG
jgi:DNA-binding PadR family transcriptional regulator